MDKSGYKTYLQSLGNQQYYIGCIQELSDLEMELNIDLDDYIPYNNDYSKCKALDEILPEDKLYNERLSFSINSYMRYRMSGFDGSKESEKELDNNLISSEYFTFDGTKNELKAKLSTFMSESDSQSFINNFSNFDLHLENNEFINTTIMHPNTNSKENPRMMYLLIPSLNYNINIKATTLISIALLLDIKLTLGFVSTLLSIVGFNNQTIVHINASEGEKCLILEAMQSKNHIINEDIFSICNSECIHNDLQCKYQNEDKCTIKKENIKQILNGLCEKNIFKKINNLYKYNF